MRIPMRNGRSAFQQSLSLLGISICVATVVVDCAPTEFGCEGYSTCPPGGASGTAGSAASGASGKADGGSSGAHAGGAGTAGSTAGAPGGASGTSGMNGMSGEAGNFSAAGADQAGAGGALLPCNGACAGEKPVCDPMTDTCVACLAQADCNTVPGRPACDLSTNACVECTDNPDCKDSAKALCDKTAERCVACLQQSDCKLATASACNAGTCAACTKDAECSNIAGKGVCNAGTCVQCTAAKEAACNGTSCNPALNQCTTTPVGTKDLCQACVADSECIGGTQADPDTRCVPMKFMGTARSGGFCLRRVAKTCAAPYKIPLDAVSLSSAPSETYCGINQDGTRCEAVLDLTTNGGKCADGLDTSCGCTRDRNGTCMQSGLGGLCRMVGVDTNRCTYVCGVPDECPIGKACGGVGYCH